MKAIRCLIGTASIAVIALGAGVASSQTYPNRTIYIVTGGIGGSSDFGARIIAQEISGPLGQPVVVRNMPTRFQVEFMRKAPPDGYTLLQVGSTFYIQPLMEKASYDPVTDFSPITLTDKAFQVLAVHPSLPVKSVKDLIALAKARPGELNYAAGSTGGTTHLSMELFKAMANVNIMHIAYRQGGDSDITALLGGEVQLTFGSANTVVRYIKSGRLRALAITSAEPSPLMPGVPTVAATVPGYESIAIKGMYALANTPATIIKRLNEEIVRVLNKPDVKEKFLKDGVETVGSSPEQLTAAMRADMARMGKVIRDAGIKAD